MKKTLWLLIITCITLQGCVTKNVKVTKTVSKTLHFVFNVDKTGNFQAVQVLSNGEITELFQTTDGIIRSSTIEKVDIKTVLIGATILPQNTATQLVLNSQLQTGEKLLNDTQTLTIKKGDDGIDFGNAFGKVVGITDELTLYNFVTGLNKTGADKLKKLLEENLTGVSNAGLNIRLNGTVPPAERLVMRLVIDIEGTITFTRCEEIVVMIVNPMSKSPYDTKDECK